MQTVVLVTGGAGYIGSHTCAALERAGYVPVTYDNLDTGHAASVQWGPLEVGDVRDPARLDEVFAHHRPTAVVHFAASAYVGESVRDPARYYRNNVVGTLELLDAMRRHAVDQMVFSSTCATFGVPQSLPITEATDQSPVNPYGMSKLVVEKMLADHDHAYGLRSVALRYFNAAGADCEGRLGELHEPETHLIPLVLDAAAGERGAIDVLGDSYPTGDGSCIRDYIHVSDLAEAHVLALGHLERTNRSDAFNLGSETGSSVFEVVDGAREVTGRPIDVRIAPPRPGDPPALVASARRARDELGWVPLRSDLRTILTDAWRWHRSNRRADLVANGAKQESA
jgi:UDP-arabinose 4-epimerase